MRELMRHGLDLDDCKEILDQGYDAPRKRAKGTLERWLDRGSKTWNAVVVESYNRANREEIYLIIHVGVFATPRAKRVPP